MDTITKKTFFINAILIVNADGKVNPREEQFIRGLVERAGITDEQMREWLREAQSGERALRPLGDPALDAEALKLMVGAASANRKLDRDQEKALITWAKSTGISFDELKRTVRSQWGTDVLEALFITDQSATETDGAGLVISVVSDHFDTLEAFMTAGEGFRLEVRPLDRLDELPVKPRYIVFHAAEEKDTTLATSDRLWRALPETRQIMVAHRAQAFQISYLLERHVYRCMVEPIYPGELHKLTAEAGHGRGAK